ncbi:MAG: DNA mismatch repair protein MutS, partial [Bacteroidota bacterium]|nr:DNA mismatch repair protein MutS [Bacteroidota bacterium]
MIKEPELQYEERIILFSDEKKRFESNFNRLSIVRAGVFILSVILLVYLANDRNFTWVWIIALCFPLIFGAIVKYHNKIRYKRNHAQILSDINKEEILKINGNLKIFETGDRFHDDLHPYAKDLDIFGHNSLYQLLNRCNTLGGKSLLANWLKGPSNNETIISRQESIKELYPQLEWRQEFEARGRHFKDEKENINALLTLIESEDLLPKLKFLKLAILVLPFLSLITIVLWIFYNFHYLFPLSIIIVNAIVLKMVNSFANDASEKTYKGNTALKSYSKLIEMIEKTNFKSQKLIDLKHFFHHQKFKASSEIKKLQIILDFLQVRNNVFYQLINVILILDVYWLLKGELWKKKSGQYVKKWFASIDEIEALNSLAGFKYSNPDFCFPKLVKETHYFSSKSLGHPLIKKNIRVYNDFEMMGKGKVIIITGSNMAGKSTFLRTVAINVVLALIGAPVCASSLVLSNIYVFTSMRTEDNLEESVSSFYAELKRLKQLLNLLEEGSPVLFMLDEILKGTNSMDRHLGAIALIKQLN